jgi:hypothetical protein
VFTARYALSPYIKQTRFVFKGLKTLPSAHTCIYVFCMGLPTNSYYFPININWLVFINERRCVYCAVRTEPLCIMQFSFSHMRVNIIKPVEIQREALACINHALGHTVRVSWSYPHVHCVPRGASFYRTFTKNTRYELENFWHDICSRTQVYVVTSRLCCSFEVHSEHFSSEVYTAIPT